jgi:molybdopterin synthase catalytic subunit
VSAATPHAGRAAEDAATPHAGRAAESAAAPDVEGVPVSAAGLDAEGAAGPTAHSGVVALVGVVDNELELDAHEQAVAERRAGAVVSFQGVVRDHDHGRSVIRLDYEGHPTAEAVLREVAEEIAAGPDVYAVAVSHRVGSLRIGDVALVAAVSTAHRAAAFAACARLVDEAKARLPIWKHQVFDDGTDEWVNCP